MNKRRVVRYLWFGISIIIGLMLGLFAGWSRSIDASNAPLSSLRQDFQLDIVLMIAEIYHQDGDLEAAQHRLAYLAVEDDQRFVQQAALDAHQIGYSTADLELLVSHAQALGPDVQPTETGATP